ncbi:MAG TPA: hypothetical protein VL523_03905 [Terriglobia bacterium]|nr:hypothetical protein [Terriglobia bacterium]
MSLEGIPVNLAIARPARLNPQGVAALTLALAFLGAGMIRVRIDRGAQNPGALSPVVYVTSGETLRRFSFGYSGLLADVYWTRAVQYFGRERLAGRSELQTLAPLLRVATTLDPHLLIAYRFGAIFLAEKPPAGAGRPDEALTLIRRGIAANPSYWRLWQDLGFIYYWDLKDYAGAARAFEEGSRQPGADLWMKTMAASVAAQGGELSTSLLLWSEVYRQAGNESIRRSAVQHLAAIEAAQALEQLNRALAAFEKRAGRPASSFADLVKVGLLTRQPLDPAGVPFVINNEGKAALGAGSPIDLRLAR